MNYINHHSHSSYSNISTPDSTISNKDRAKRTLELGMTVLSSVEHSYTGRFIEIIELSKENNLKPLLGTEAYFVKNRLEKDKTNAHLILLAKNENGRKAINFVLSEANISGYYYKPRTDLELILSLPRDDVWITSACLGGVWRYEDHEDLIIQFKNHFKENFFLEVQPHHVESQKKLNLRILELSKKHNIKIIAGMDSHMIYPNQAKERDDYLLSRGIQYPDEDNWFLDFPSYEEAFLRFEQQGILSDEQIFEALNNTNIFEQVEKYDSIIFDDQIIKLPTLYPTKTQEEKDKIFEELIWSQWNKEKKKIKPELYEKYETEIKKELKTIIDTKMADYFLLDYEIIKKGKENGGRLTLTGRGSAVSFYISKLLEFTTIDRISAKVKMFPERFISTERILQTKSLPDIDFNCGTPHVFTDAQSEIMGKEHSYPMIAFGTMRASGAWKLYARVSGLDFDEANMVSDQIKEYESELKYAETEEDKEHIDVHDFIDPKYHKIYDESLKYLNLVNSVSVHPCAWLIFSDEDIKKEFGLIKTKSSSGNENICVNCDGLFAEKYKLLKNDWLKVDVVNLIYDIYEKIGKEPDEVSELIDICNGDDETWSIYKNGLSIGINQFEKKSTSLKGMRYSPKNPSESCAFIAAIRPGFQSNYSQFESRQPFSYGIETLDNLIQTEEFPQSYMLYQENAMQVMEYAGIPISDTYDVIKNIAKKRYDKVIKNKDRFIKGMKKRIIEVEKRDAKEATKISNMIWQIIEDSSKYSFNCSHSYCMAADSLYGAYLKSHYPLQFYTSFMQIMEEKGDKDRIGLAQSEAQKAFSIKFPPFKFGQDNRKITLNTKTNEINKSLKTIKGFGEKVAEDLYNLSQLYQGNNFCDLLVCASDNGIISSKFEQLIKINYFSDFGKNKKLHDFYLEFTKGKNRYSKTLTEKSKNKRLPELYSLLESLPNKNYLIQQQVKNELEILNEIQTSFPVNKNYGVAINLDLKYSPKIEFQNLLTGERKTFKIKKSIYNEFPINKSDILLFKKVAKKNAMTRNEENKWVKIEDKFDLWLDVYYVVKETDKLLK